MKEKKDEWRKDGVLKGGLYLSILYLLMSNPSSIILKKKGM